MTSKIAIAIVHGAGEQSPDYADGMIERIQHEFKELFPDNKAPTDDLVFKPIYWADILSDLQMKVWETVSADANLRWTALRKHIMMFTADAIAYQPSRSRNQVYARVHDRFTAALEELAQETVAGPDAPLCVIGHSLGTIISHNVLYDLMFGSDKIEGSPEDKSALEKAETLALLYTLGSPMAVWSLRFASAGEYKPIKFPGKKVRELYPAIQPKWTNCYDEDDVFSFPVRSLSEEHKQLAAQKLLIDKAVNVGNRLQSWTPLSHAGYWTDKDVTGLIAADLMAVWKAVNASA